MGNDKNSRHLMGLSMILILFVATQKNREDETKKFRDKNITIHLHTPIEVYGIPGGNTIGVVLARTNERLQHSGARARTYNCSL